MLLLCIFSLLFGQNQVVAHASHPGNKAATPIIYAKAENTPRANTPEMQSIEIYNGEDHRRAVEWAAKELAKNRETQIPIVTVSPEKHVDRHAANLVQQAATEVTRKLGEKPGNVSEVKIIENHVPEQKLTEIQAASGPSATGFFAKHHRLTFTLLRGTMNGVITGSALILSAGVPIVPSLAIAIFTGVTAGGFQYFQPQVQKFINGDQALKERRLSSGMVGKIQVKTVQLSRIFLINSITFFATQMVTLAVGATAFGTPLSESIKIFRSSAISTASGGIWSAANASLTYDSLEANKFNPEKHDAIHRRAAIISFSVSMVGAFGSILTLIGVPLGYWTMGAIGLTGTLFTIWTMRRSQSVLKTSTGRFNINGLRNAVQWDLGCP